MTLSVVIPAHNEEGNLEPTIRALVTTLDAHRIPHEIVVVDDHSTDGTPALLEALSRALPTVRSVKNEAPPGYGYAVRAGLDAYAGDAVCIVMADASDDPDDLVLYYRELEKGYDCAFGSRFAANARVTNYPRLKLMLNRMANWAIRVLFGFAYNDVTNAFKCFRRTVIDGVRPLLSCHFNLTVELPLKAIVRGYSYSVVPTQWRGREIGLSKLKIKEMGSRYLFIVLYVLLERWLSRGDYRGRPGAVTPPAPPSAHAPDPDANLGRRERRWLDLAAAVLITVACARGVMVTYDLDWPKDPDLYRDIAQAQTIRDGSFVADPHYLGETVWYPPLVPALVAGLQWLTGAEMHVLETRAGAYLNVLGPVAFYVMTRALLGRWTALVATAIFLFCAGDSGPSYASSTYTPWLFVANFVQALFYLCILALYRAAHTNRGHHFVVVGAMLGVTFLGHAAPATLIGGLVGVYMATRALRLASRRQWVEVRRTLARFALVVVVALVVSAPFLASIVGNYGLRIVHLHPTFWIYPDMEVANLGRFLNERLSRNVVVPALVGLVALLTTRRARPSWAWLLGWMGLAMLGVMYSYVWQIQAARNVIWPSVVPGFHYLRYFDAGESILAAYGVVTAGGGLAWLVARWPATAPWGAPLTRRLVPALLGAALVSLSYPAYARRVDLTMYRDQAQQMFLGVDDVNMFRWLRRELGPTDVVAAPELLSLIMIGPAGRKVLVVDRFFSNPYVSWAERYDTLNALYYGLDGGFCDNFRERADQYHVTHVVTAADAVRPEVASRCGIVPGFVGRNWIVYRRLD
jgi:dolichol-phosphate mannosyltransferase